MKSNTKFISLVLCILMICSMIPFSAFGASNVNILTVEIDEPALGKKPGKGLVTPDCKSSEYVGVEWIGELDENGCFKTDVLYTVIFTVKIKDDVDRIFASKMQTLKINGNSIANENHYSFRNDRKEIRFIYDFPYVLVPSGNKITTQGFISKATVTIPEPKPGKAPGTAKQATIESSTVHVDKIDWIGELDENGCFRHDERYTARVTLRINGGYDKYFRYGLALSDFTINGKKVEKITSLPDRQSVTIDYTFPKQGDSGYTSTKISQVDSFYFDVNPVEKWVVPSIEFDENLTKDFGEYTLTISYDTPEIKLYDWYIVTATYKAKPGYSFTKDTTVKQPKKNSGVDIESFTSDTLTAKVYTYTCTNYEGIAPTPSMINYQERRARPDYYKSPDSYVGKGISVNPGNNFKIPVYKYPTANSPVIDDYSTRTEVTRNDTGFQIKDFTISDEITDIEGEWYYVGNGFMPACFVKVVGGGLFDGGPAVLVDSTWKFAGGSGTAEDPFLISTPEQLNAIRFGLNYHYKLINDIDLSSWGNWVPIGGNPAYGGYAGDKYNEAQFGVTYFGGTLDGDGHVISGMTIIINEDTPFKQETGNTRYYGLFAHFNSDFDGSGIKNLGLVNYTIDINYKSSKNLHIWAGGFAGKFGYCQITNCYTSGGSINFNIVDDDSYEGANFKIGSFAGEMDHCTISKCYNTSDITVNTNILTSITAGGIAGNCIDSHFSECFNSGDINLPVGNYYTFWRSSFAGGIVPQAIPANISGGYNTIKDCYNSGNITANFVSGLFVYASNVTCELANCYNVGKLTAETTINISGTIKSYPTIAPFDGAYASKCYADGNSVSGNAWTYSQTLGRKVLKAIPEDSVKTYTKPSSNPFSDVRVGDYFEQPVEWALKKGITTGTSATTFSPNDTCTKAQIITFLWRAMGSPATESANPYNDVSETDYYYNAALWAHEKGIVSGNSFEGGTPCTRASTVIYLWKAKGSPIDNETTIIFEDLPTDEELTNAVKWAFKYNVTSGTSLFTFAPDATCTRGQIATFLYRGIIV